MAGITIALPNLVMIWHDESNARGAVLTSHAFRRMGLTSAIAAAAILSACNRAPSEAESIAAARKSLADGQPRAAIINLRDALQHNVNSPEARLLMGEALLASSEFSAAADEFKRARSAGLSDVAYAPPMARALLQLGQQKKVIEEFGNMRLDDKAADGDLSLSLAKAYGLEGNLVQSERLLDRSLTARPDYAAARVYRARMVLVKSGVDAALAELNSPPELLKTNAEALRLEAGLKLDGKRDVDGAIESFKRALVLEPKDFSAHESLIAIYLYKGDKEAARKQVQALKQAAPNLPVARLYEAQMALLDGDVKAARTLALQVVQVAPQSVRALFIAASAELQLGNGFGAVTFLQRAQALQPSLLEVNKLLAQAYLKSGQPQLALKLLARALDRAPKDPTLLSTAAEAHLQLGDAKTSEALFKQALLAKPGDVRTGTALAMATIARGDSAEGIRQLADLAQKDSSSVADLALISSHLASNKTDAALEQVSRLERKEPASPLPVFIRARILLTRGDVAGARAALEEALKRDSGYVAAMSTLSLLDLRDGKADVARARFEATLKKVPNNAAVLMAMADLLVLLDAPQSEVVSLMDRAIGAEPGSAAPHLMLVDYLMTRNSYSAAVVAAQKAVAQVDSSPELLNALGRAQSASGASAQAQASFAKQAQLQPGSAMPYLSAAEAYRRAGDRANALRSLRQALGVDPKFLPAQEALFGLELRAEHFPAALELAKDVQRQRPVAVTGYHWEGAVYTAQKRWDQAIEAYKRGIVKLQAEKRDATVLAGAVHLALVNAKREPEAARFAQDWIKANPKDSAFHMYLGDLALRRQDWATAEQEYRKALEIYPTLALAANNAAAMLVRLGSPEAVAMAERAVKLAPNDANMLDTLAMALAKDKQWSRAIEVRRKAIALGPSSSALKIKLARLLIDAGQKREAEVELKALQALEGKFDRQADVAAMLKEL